MNPDSLQVLQNATRLPQTSTVGLIIWFFLGLLFVYLEIWMKPEVEESWNGPCAYAKIHARSVVFAILSYVAVFSLWLTAGLNFDVNGENIISLEKGKLNGMICVVAYFSSGLFTAFGSKYEKVRNLAPPTT